MSTEEIRALERELRSGHVESPDGGHCYRCGEDWPCIRDRAADALALLVPVVEAAEHYRDCTDGRDVRLAEGKIVFAAVAALAEAKP